MPIRRGKRTFAVAALLVAAAFLAAAGAASADDRAPPRPTGDVIGSVRSLVASHEDTLLDIARVNGLGYVEMVAANPGVDPWVPGRDTPVVLPTAYVLPDVERRGLVVNLAEHRLYYFAAPGAVPMTFPLGVGRKGGAHRSAARKSRGRRKIRSGIPRSRSGPRSRTCRRSSGPAPTIPSAATRSISPGPNT